MQGDQQAEKEQVEMEQLKQEIASLKIEDKIPDTLLDTAPEEALLEKEEVKVEEKLVENESVVVA